MKLFNKNCMPLYQTVRGTDKQIGIELLIKQRTLVLYRALCGLVIEDLNKKL
jgi:hypothetical protein